jgi:hypothetical protein
MLQKNINLTVGTAVLLSFVKSVTLLLSLLAQLFYILNFESSVFVSHPSCSISPNNPRCNEAGMIRGSWHFLICISQSDE